MAFTPYLLACLQNVPNVMLGHIIGVVTTLGSLWCGRHAEVNWAAHHCGMQEETTLVGPSCCDTLGWETEVLVY